MKSCGSCKNFLKLDKYSVCELKDARANSDDGHQCKDFKRVKFYKKEEAFTRDFKKFKDIMEC